MNTTKYDELELSTLKYNELQGLCKEEGLKANRKKVELIAALKAIPAYDNDSVNDTSSSVNLTLEDSELEATISGSPDASRPAFGDISVIANNSPLVEGRGKRRKLANALRDSDKENSEMVNTTSRTAPAMLERLERVTADRLKGEMEMEKLIKQLEEPARKVTEFIEQKKMELDKCRATGETHYRHLLEEQLMEKERELKERHRNEMKTLKSQIQATERTLRNKLNEAIQEANKLREQNSSSQTMFNIELQKKNEEIKSCTESLQLFTVQGGIKDREIAELNTVVASNRKDNDALKKEIACVRESLKEREEEKGTLQTLFHDLTKKMSLKDSEIKRQNELLQAVEQATNGNSIMDSMEDELTCIICQELFVTASTLPCAHSFCEMCLRSWFKTKKTCPVCRADVKLKVVFSVVLDSVIDCCIEKSSDDVKRKRTMLLRERNEQKRTADAAADPQSVKTMFYKAGDLTDVASTPVASAAGSSTASAGSSGGYSAGSSAGGAIARGRAGVDAHRRRSRSISPRRNIVNRAFQAINYSISRINSGNSSQQYQHNIVRCFNCGRNHHVRDCQYGRPPQQR